MGNEVEFGKQEGYKGVKKEEFSREGDVPYSISEQ